MDWDRESEPEKLLTYENMWKSLNGFANTRSEHPRDFSYWVKSFHHDLPEKTSWKVDPALGAGMEGGVSQGHDGEISVGALVVQKL